ncbi:protein yellow-like [Cylas formicarius]|uniref:protein yellow-like n=1 Tax=Cylas formicarius TaxID=197179 RepID=UPI002958813E|nr:protein yellow-like [Cylas formicarius]
MAVDNWFQTWHPPDSIFQQSPFFDTLGNENFTVKQDRIRVKTKRPESFLPLLLSLGLMQPSITEKKINQPLELTGPFKTWYRWKTLDLDYPSDEARSRAVAYDEFIPENNLPLGLETYGDRIFLSMPKWKPGVPVTLATVPRLAVEESPKLVPYPNWDWHSEKTCDVITSVFRMQADHCGRLWVLDSGTIEVTIDAKQHCPPKLLIFDLRTDELIEKYVFPDEFIKEDGLYSNIVLDFRDGDCDNIYAYMTDVWRYGIVVFNLETKDAWRVTHPYFYPDPFAATYRLHHLEFHWMDGIFGAALSPARHPFDDRTLYFHPMSSFREFYVKTSVLQDEHRWQEDKHQFKVFGQSRGAKGHVSGSVMDRNGVLFYNLVTKDTIGCWNSRKPYKRENLGVVATSRQTLVFPNDIRLDQEERQSIWIVTNRLPYYLIEGLDTSRINFRVMSAYTDEAVRGTICDTDINRNDTYVPFEGENDCY